MDSVESLPDCEIVLPAEWDGFFDPPDHSPIPPDERRNYPRRCLRSQALMIIEGQRSTIYIKDFSRSGVGFLHAEQLFPSQKICIVFTNRTTLHLRVVRCRRVAQKCYECGAVMQAVPGDESAEQQQGKL